ncbi:hypothetical protein KR100_04195 [Synechococcus sp. KORDI-100]|nr:hypothetical protein KR100_04195 [Synechococcus sp. KORDI-100]
MVIAGEQRKIILRLVTPSSAIQAINPKENSVVIPPGAGVIKSANSWSMRWQALPKLVGLSLRIVEMITMTMSRYGFTIWIVKALKGAMALHTLQEVILMKD